MNQKNNKMYKRKKKKKDETGNENDWRKKEMRTEEK